MKPFGQSGLKHCMTAKEWLLVFLLALALHLLLFSLFEPIPITVAESSSEKRYTFFLDEQKLSQDRQDSFALKYWLEYSDPERFLKPDPAAGFSLFQNRKDNSIPDPAQLPRNLFESSADCREVPASLPSPRPHSDFVPGTASAFSPHLSKPHPVPNVQYPLWLDEDGGLYSGLFYADRKSMQLLKQERADGKTVLLLTLEKDRLPAVELVRSCGNLKLDMLALRQLMCRKANFVNVPASPVSRHFTVIWRMPGMKAIRKETLP